MRREKKILLEKKNTSSMEKIKKNKIKIKSDLKYYIITTKLGTTRFRVRVRVNPLGLTLNLTLTLTLRFI